MNRFNFLIFSLLLEHLRRGREWENRSSDQLIKNNNFVPTKNRWYAWRAHSKPALKWSSADDPEWTWVKWFPIRNKRLVKKGEAFQTSSRIEQNLNKFRTNGSQIPKKCKINVQLREFVICFTWSKLAKFWSHLRSNHNSSQLVSGWIYKQQIKIFRTWSR